MGYNIVLSKNAAKDIRALDNAVAKRLIKKIIWLEKQDQPLHFGKNLQQSPVGDFRFRVGDYRLIAVVHEKEKVIEIIRIGHRRDVYL